jgi:hypothetical protein
MVETCCSSDAPFFCRYFTPNCHGISRKADDPVSGIRFETSQMGMGSTRHKRVRRLKWLL